MTAAAAHDPGEKLAQHLRHGGTYLNAVEIEQAITDLAEQSFDGENFPYAFLEAFGNKATTIQRLRAYFSPSWTAFQAERGRDFSVIVDDLGSAQVIF